ncbi:organic hydroperoxide resistance protein [Aliamphritea spongicola]|uniref:organic hydroperoxide resistance protein n=1 Tax=Aliamphritea spongicola TaxID=707589 RepID=UPI00196A7FB4|nr:organic hydroperoxide resistance protein [Aliamphritea spongicola]MBN3562688.1 organic hydroperoxide resistance protein [Aliamphritea spongicola]
MQLDKTLYVAKAEATGGREGYIRSDDGALDMPLTTPKALGGEGKFGVNPEQLFAAGYAACFIGAMKVVAQRNGKILNSAAKVNGEVGIGPVGKGFNISVVLNIDVPEMPRDELENLVSAAHEVCPYSNATRNNVDVVLKIV